MIRHFFLVLDLHQLLLASLCWRTQTADHFHRTISPAQIPTLGRAGAQAASASDPLSWGAGTECEAAKRGGAGAAADCDHTGARRRLRAYADPQRAVAHDLGALVKTHSWNCDIDIEQCPHCGGQLKLIAAIEEPAATQRILTHLGLVAQPSPRVPARRVDMLQAASWTNRAGWGQGRGRRSSGARANARMECKSGTWDQSIVSDVEKMAGVQCMGTRLTARASSDTFMIREKGRLKFLYPPERFHGAELVGAVGGER